MTPSSTYRLQLRPGFGFQEAAAVLPYLAHLGVSHAYFSPYLQAAPGSTHGYDVVDPTQVSQELGGAEGLEMLRHELARHGLGQVLDIVPNHMAADPSNPWWRDVLENGPSSRVASYFDVDWGLPSGKPRHRILVPVLGDDYGTVLAAGELRVERDRGSFEVAYGDRRYPLAPDALPLLLRPAAEASGSAALAALLDGLAALPELEPGQLELAQARHLAQEGLKARLTALLVDGSELARAVDRAVADANSSSGRLDALLRGQHYRLSSWAAPNLELNYRRFFDVTGLVGVRVEEDRVFADTHRLVLSWLENGDADGVRVDHPDGLRDPDGYLRGLRAAAPATWIVAEKILAPAEELPDWPVAGTTGYDFLNLTGGLFVDPAGEEPLTRLYCELTGEAEGFGPVAHAARLQVLRELLASDVERLTDLFVKVCERHWEHRDRTREELREALSEYLACLPVYRTYGRPGLSVGAQDLHFVQETIAAARENRPELDGRLFDFLRELALFTVPGQLEAELGWRLQQTSAPVMAKGVEDTAFYRYNRFTALNEVGGSPDRFGVSREEFHQGCLRASERWPGRMLATATHDHKRGEDVRARLYLLSEISGQWEDAVRRWSSHNEALKTTGAPDANLEYLLYQVLVGAYPLPLSRALAYALKAAREAKVNTSWLHPDPGFELALRGFVEGILADQVFVADLEAFVAPLLAPGWRTSLAQKLICLTAPGVPDVYQGTELWDLSLVDPDNRSPVDFELRAQLAGEIDTIGPEQAWERAALGLPKLLVVARALRLRQRRPDLFAPGARYEALSVTGPKERHLVAFARAGGALTLAPRLLIGLGGDWGETSVNLPPGRWRDEFTGEVWEGGQQALSGLLTRFPVGLLVRQ